MTIEDIEFEDAVIRIPKNAVKVTVEIETYETEGVQTVRAQFLPSDIAAMFDLFEQTVNGDYPRYVLTEEGQRYLDQLKGETKC